MLTLEELKKEIDDVRARRIVLYFLTKNSKFNHLNPHNATYTNAFKLDQMIWLYREKQSKVERIIEFTKIFKDYESFESAYSCLDKYADNEIVNKIVSAKNKVGRFYKVCEDNGFKSIAPLLQEIDKEKYCDDYKYALQFVLDYINYKESPFINDFLNYVGIDNSSFTRFVTIIAELNPDLYDEYSKVANDNRSMRRAIVMEKLQNIKCGVETGYTKEGTPFDSIEFFANMPFYNDLSAKEVFEDFEISNVPFLDKKLKSLLFKVDSESAPKIVKYIYSNELLCNGSKQFKEQEIYNTRCSVDGRLITDEEKRLILGYIKERNIAPLERAYKEVRDRYLDGTLKVSQNKKLTKNMGV